MSAALFLGGFFAMENFLVIRYDGKGVSSVRALQRGIISPFECDTLRNIIDSQSETDAFSSTVHTEPKLYKSIRVLDLDVYCDGENSGGSKTCHAAEKKTSEADQQAIRSLQHKVLSSVRKTFNSSRIHIEHASLTSRAAGYTITFGDVMQEVLRMVRELVWFGRLLNPDGDMSVVNFVAGELACALDPRNTITAAKCTGGHPLHSDSCAFDYRTGVCEKTPKHCCSWRTHAAVLYLDDGGGRDFSGGDFLFVDPSNPDGPPSLIDMYMRRRKVVPKRGSLVAFKSGASNIHGVTPVVQGVRHAAVFWFSDATQISMPSSLTEEPENGRVPGAKPVCLIDQKGAAGRDGGSSDGGHDGGSDGGEFPIPTRRCGTTHDGEVAAEISPDPEESLEEEEKPPSAAEVEAFDKAAVRLAEDMNIRVPPLQRVEPVFAAAAAGMAREDVHVTLFANGGTTSEKATLSTESFATLLSERKRLYNGKGELVTSLRQVTEAEKLYAGPAVAGTHFQWPTVEVGNKVEVSGVVSPSGKPIVLEALSNSPKVFYVHNFMSDEEAEFLKASAVHPLNPYKMKPSTTWGGGGRKQHTKTRTSMNAFDMSSQVAVGIKHRAFKLLRLNDYDDSMADGIQVLKYELGQAYTPHHDYFETDQSHWQYAWSELQQYAYTVAASLLCGMGYSAVCLDESDELNSGDHSGRSRSGGEGGSGGEYNWDPKRGGGNRWATVFMYLSEVEAGGQTVFPGSPRLQNKTNEALVRRLGNAPSQEQLDTLLEKASFVGKQSWEADLIKKCYTQFAVPPRKGDAILFYSQTPDGTLDPSSFHGACPVLSGTKWAANLWVWNAARFGSPVEDVTNPAASLGKNLHDAKL
jgi:prolyl 4-hydroxylase